MPEGPEVKRQADRLDRTLAGQQAEEVWFAFPELQAWGEALSGQSIGAVEARGKAFLVRFPAAEVSIYVHLQLYGRWEVRTPRGGDPRTGRSLRLRLVTARGRALLYSASTIEVVPDAELAAHPYLRKLGPDVLRRGLTARAIQRRLSSARFQRRSLGALYLDQSFLGGLGNYLRSEVLFEAGLLPAQAPRALSDDQLERLARATLKICRRAYRTGGITNEPELVAELKASGARRRELRWKVFGREGEPCWDCGHEVERTTVGGRRLYLCPACQR
ncbi:MAG: endonuclease VIII [Planctomycetes bacterium]|nr:endonuclease VIII [Planctomycetota bacterium]